MKCYNAWKCEYILFEIEEHGVTTFYRRDTDEVHEIGEGWEQLCGESWESIYDVEDEFEEIYQEQLKSLR
jgi:hypothetical protein